MSLKAALNVVRHAPKNSAGKLLDRTLASECSKMLVSLRAGNKSGVEKHAKNILKATKHASKK